MHAVKIFLFRVCQHLTQGNWVLTTQHDEVQGPEEDEEKRLVDCFDTPCGRHLTIRHFYLPSTPKVIQGNLHPLLVKFVNRKKKLEVFWSRMKLRNSNLTHPVFINEHLTKESASTFAEARRLVKTKKILQIWTKNGRVVLRQLNSVKKTISSKSELVKY